MPGADVNPYLAIAGMVAGALHGIDSELELERRAPATRTTTDRPQRAPGTLRDALALWEGSDCRPGGVRRRGGGPLRQPGEVELAAFDAAVTDWELIRGFERL